MVYNTYFTGKFTLDRPLSTKEFKEIVEFIADCSGDKSKDDFLRYTCHWKIKSDRQTIVCDKNGDFSCSIKWIKFLISKFFEPWSYKVNGEVSWKGNHYVSDTGIILIQNNRVTVTDKEELSDALKIQNTQLIKQVQELEKYVTYLETHIRCSPDGELALSAKADFVKLCSKDS